MKQIAAESTLERIRRYYLEEDFVLTQKEEDLRQRYSAAFSSMLNDHESDKNVVSILMKEYSISEVQAYRDIAAARVLFGDIRNSNKEALRYMVTEWAKELFRLAREKKDFKGMEKALERITKANNLDKEDQDLPDPSKIHPPVQLLTINFNFIDSEFFKYIDEKAKTELLRLHEQILQLVEKSPARDYLDMFQVTDVDHQEVK